MHLRELQKAIVQALFDPQQLPIAAAEAVSGDRRLTAQQRLGIYRHSVQGILLQHLRALYPVVEQLVGAEFFEHLTELYIDQSPPVSPALSDYGQSFIDLLRYDDRLDELRWIAEVAEVEWARHFAWQATNQTMSDFSQLATLDETLQTQLRFQLPNSATVLKSDYAIHAIWLAHQVEDYADKTPFENIQLHTPTHLLIGREGRRLYQYVLDEQQFALLYGVQEGETLEQLAARLDTALPQVLSTALQKGWIRGFTCN